MRIPGLVAILRLLQTANRTTSCRTLTAELRGSKLYQALINRHLSKTLTEAKRKSTAVLSSEML